MTVWTYLSKQKSVKVTGNTPIKTEHTNHLIHKFKSHPQLINTRAIISICGYSPFPISITAPTSLSSRVTSLRLHIPCVSQLRSAVRTQNLNTHLTPRQLESLYRALSCLFRLHLGAWGKKTIKYKETRTKFNMLPRTTVNRKYQYIRTGRGWFNIPIQLRHSK
jgi:hypothetical protein